MKKVVKGTLPSDIVQLTEVNSQKYYGLKHPNDNSRGFISRSKFCNGEYIPMCCDELTNGNRWSCSDSLTKLIGDLMSGPRPFTVYEFDTHKELFGWLAE